MKTTALAENGSRTEKKQSIQAMIFKEIIFNRNYIVENNRNVINKEKKHHFSLLSIATNRSSETNVENLRMPCYESYGTTQCAE